MKTLLLLSTMLLMTACSNSVSVLPLPSTAKPAVKTAVMDKTTQKGTATLYRCKDDKEVRIVRNINTGNKSKKRQKSGSVINLTFNNVTQKLTSTVSESGNSYTNIHWHWFERGDANMLTTSVGKVLAEQCIIQKASPLEALEKDTNK
ncbi:MliC family protein [Basfia succiniciproducens]|uniref:Membrane-bound lysozyme-inhibitor of c-type lysozyme n=1 Tax=Basfia succiniciproducens TaxID=653940 RepID=A0A1G5DHB2_9PAST|nr:MliC family protein [Basfia succiniciproducens]SCY13931.1 Membrane-bound lysozyme-inhibitor of c-type lysozyme [Basfia succiniciproducens]